MFVSWLGLFFMLFGFMPTNIECSGYRATIINRPFTYLEDEFWEVYKNHGDEVIGTELEKLCTDDNGNFDELEASEICYAVLDRTVGAGDGRYDKAEFDDIVVHFKPRRAQVHFNPLNVRVLACPSQGKQTEYLRESASTTTTLYRVFYVINSGGYFEREIKLNRPYGTRAFGSQSPATSSEGQQGSGGSSGSAEGRPSKHQLKKSRSWKLKHGGASK